MKLRKAIKVAVAGAALAPVVAMAAAPIGFDNWTANASSISTGNDDAGFSYGTANTEAGFLQRQISSGGQTWIQTIVTESSATETFMDENFVLMGGSGGIADKSEIHEDDLAGETFDTVANIMTGDLKSMSDSKVNLTQDVGSTGSGFTTGFTFDHNMAMAKGIMSGGMYAEIKLNTSVSTADFTGGFNMRELEIEGATNTTMAAMAAGLEIGITSDVVDGTELDQLFTLNEIEGSYVAESGNLVGSLGAVALGFSAGGSVEGLTIDQAVGGAGDFLLEDLKTDLAAGDTDMFTAGTPGFSATYTGGGTPFTFSTP